MGRWTSSSFDFVAAFGSAAIADLSSCDFLEAAAVVVAAFGLKAGSGRRSVGFVDSDCSPKKVLLKIPEVANSSVDSRFAASA